MLSVIKGQRKSKKEFLEKYFSDTYIVRCKNNVNVAILCMINGFRIYYSGELINNCTLSLKNANKNEF